MLSFCINQGTRARWESDTIYSKIAFISQSPVCVWMKEAGALFLHHVIDKCPSGGRILESFVHLGMFLKFLNV